MMDVDPRLRIALIAALTIGIAGGAAGSAVAQDVPEGQSCGGLVCDLGLFGHKVPPAAAPAPVVAQPAPARAVVRPEAKADAVAEQRKPPVHRKARVAKAVAAERSIVAGPALVAPVLGAPPVAATLLAPPPATATLAPPPAAPATVARTAVAPPAPSPIDAILGPQPKAVSLTPVPAGRPAVAEPAPYEPVVLANPYVSARPLPFKFQSVDPTVR